MMRKLLVVLASGAVLVTAADAAFPGKNGKIAFTRHGAVYVVEPDGSGLKRLTKETLSAPAQDPAWSPDGKRIVFAAKCELYVMRADGSGLRRVTKPKPGGMCAYEPDWAPDGKRIVFARRAGRIFGASRGGIYVINANGTGERALSVKRITRSSPEDSYPSFSPDGKQIAFARNDYSGSIPSPAVWIMRPDGTQQRRLTRDKTSQAENMPVWSPDAKIVAFGRVPPQVDLAMAMFVTTASPAGGGISTLALDAKRERGDEYPAFSPDGKQIAFISAGIGAMNADGSDRRVVTRNTDDYSPDWQPLP